MVQKRFESDEIVSPKLLAEPLYFKTSGRVTRNRILKSSLTEMISTFDLSDPKKSGLPTQRLINLYEKFGNGEYGVLLTGNMAIDSYHLEAAGNCIISKEGDTEERRQLLKRLCKAAKSDGALALVQLVHAGRQAATRINKTPFSASDVQLEGELRGHKYGKPIPLSIEQIKTEVVDRYVFAAKQCKEAGFDGIQIHGAHGYLLSQFLSLRTNRRTDRYGGSVENRVRVVEEVYRSIRAEIPASTGFIIGIKINSVEFHEDGNKTDDAIQIAKALDALGLDFIELSGGNYEKFEFYHAKESTKKREAFFSEFASAIKPHIKNAVVYLTGGFRTVSAMVKAIESGETDGIGIGRPVTIEPDLPKKLLSGQATGAAFSHYEHVFDVSMHISLTQMAQAGLTSLEEAGHDPCYGIPDFSGKEEADKFRDALAIFLDSYETDLQKGRAVTGIFEYPIKNLQKVEIAESVLTGVQLESGKVQA